MFVLGRLSFFEWLFDMHVLNKSNNLSEHNGTRTHYELLLTQTLELTGSGFESRCNH